ncbi:hypothetical protein EV127DRAFT_74662 [Xylaria flabelliformis]|nr:hypothetical protein EV127DRAFT_74662 [Xylaria flabelliformis]
MLSGLFLLFLSFHSIDGGTRHSFMRPFFAVFFLLGAYAGATSLHRHNNEQRLDVSGISYHVLGVVDFNYSALSRTLLSFYSNTLPFIPIKRVTNRPSVVTNSYIHRVAT